MKLGHLRWPELVQMDWPHTVCLLPLGSFEQHGTHLPLTTDTCLVTAVAEEVERWLDENVLLLPTLWLGCSPQHHHWPGTLSLDPGNYMDVIEAICKSIVEMGGSKIFLLNGHGGNELPAKVAMRNLKTRFRDSSELKIFFGNYWTVAWDAISSVRTGDTGSFGHASEAETALMLHLAPELVELDKAKDDGVGKSPLHLSALGAAYPEPAVYTVIDFHEVSESGTIGHAQAASTEKGKCMFEGIVPKLVDFIRDFADS